MFCPSCKCEYLRGVTECPDCGVALVDALESPKPRISDNERIVAAWRGNDPAECTTIKQALKNADIPFIEQGSKSYSALLPTEAGTEIWISEEDQDSARRIIDELEGRVDPDELTPEEIESLALPESNEEDRDEEASETDDVEEQWDEDESVAQVWTGDSESLADSLAACLREVGIASRKLSDGSRCRLVVRPEHESRAKEVVREVVEASPPQ